LTSSGLAETIRNCTRYVSVIQSVELVLSNFVKSNEATTGYFQGLNFVAHYIVIVMEDRLSSLSLLNFVGESIYSVV
jgi:hypothetical protein